MPTRDNSLLRPLKSSNGFTMIEILAVIAIIGILSGFAIFAFTGVQARARDAQRASDMRQLVRVLEQDNVQSEKYVLSTSNSQLTGHPWGARWQDYKITVPKDPLTTQTYAYVSDGENYQLFANFEGIKPGDPFYCKPCGPGNAYNAGIANGGFSTIASITPPVGPPPPPVGPPPPPVGPPPPPAPLSSGSETYSIAMNSFPNMTQLIIDPLSPTIGSNQTAQLSINDPSPITSVTATLITDHGSTIYTLNLSSGSPTDGVWSGNWTMTDSFNTNYGLDLLATDAAGQSSLDQFRFR